MKRKKISELWFGAASESRNYDWQEHFEDFEVYEMGRCDTCNKIVATHGQEDAQHCDLDEDSKCQGYVSGSGGPMMNYYYPLTSGIDEPEEAAKAIADLPLCIVYLHDNNLSENESWALALTGGGMNFGWEIAEAFMRIGFLPPAFVAEGLPAMSGRGESALDKWIISGCRRRLRAERDNAICAIQRLKRVSSR